VCSSDLALSSFGSGIGAAATLAGGSKRGAAAGAAPVCANAEAPARRPNASASVPIRLRMVPRSSRLEVFVLRLRPAAHLVVEDRLVAGLVARRRVGVLTGLPSLLVGFS